MKLINIVFEFIFYIFLLCILGAPLFLILVYPAQAQYITELGKTLIPWVCCLIILAIYSDGIRRVLGKVAEAVGKLNKFSVAGISGEINPQESMASKISLEESGVISQIAELAEQKVGANNLANHFFIRYIAATIYGSQFRFLESLEVNPLPPIAATNAYDLFLSAAPSGTDYSFSRWVGYMKENFLVNFNANENYEITPAGKNFLNTARAANLTANNFIN